MYQIYNVDTFPYDIVERTPTIRRGRKNHGGKHLKYKDVVCAFDIETTALHSIEQSFMYIWMFAYGESHVCIGRTWKEFIDFAFQLSMRCGASESIAVYVHNLSYEFQFLKGIYQFDTDEVFAINKRKVLKASMFADRIELRCSYIHSNMSLAEFTTKMEVEHGKLSGEEFDYKKTRYPWTPLTDRELEYCINDVIGLVEAIGKELKIDEDNLETIPPTSTGYVRRDTKRAMREYPRAILQSGLPDIETYRLLAEAFRGGNCHANRLYADRIIHNVVSFDRQSSYPDVMCNDKFPISRFKEFEKPTMEWAEKLMYEYDRALLLDVELTNVSLKKSWWGSPYLTRHKCYCIVGGQFDNGRVLKATRLRTTLTDIDLQIVMSEYNCGIQVIKMMKSKYGMLPQQIREINIEYFKRKTELKGVSGEEIFYMKSKNKLNSVYGMCVQSPVKQSIDYIDGKFIEREDDEEELLKRSNGRAFLNYAWGVWTTAWARYRLEEGIRIAGQNFVYGDTDSVKFIMDDVCQHTFDEYNKTRIAYSKQNGAFAVDKNGKTQYMGVYEMDAEYDSFVTMGAKKYAYELDSKISLTVSGVNKKKGGDELKKHGGLEAFKSGFVFREAGGTESIYNDSISTVIDIDGHELPITSNVYIKDSTYTLGMTAEYFNLIHKRKLKEVMQ